MLTNAIHALISKRDSLKTQLGAVEKVTAELTKELKAKTNQLEFHQSQATDLHLKIADIEHGIMLLQNSQGIVDYGKVKTDVGIGDHSI